MNGTCCFAWVSQGHLSRRLCRCSCWACRCWRPCLCHCGTAGHTRCTSHLHLQQNHYPYPEKMQRHRKNYSWNLFKGSFLTNASVLKNKTSITFDLQVGLSVFKQNVVNAKGGLMCFSTYVGALTLLWLKRRWSYWASLEERGLGFPRAMSSLMSLSWSLCSFDLEQKMRKTDCRQNNRNERRKKE